MDTALIEALGQATPNAKLQALAWLLARISPDDVSGVIHTELPRVDMATIYINLSERLEPGTLDLHGRRT